MLTWAGKWAPKQADEDMRPIYLTWEEVERARLSYNLFKTPRNRITLVQFCDLIDVRLVGE